MGVNSLSLVRGAGVVGSKKWMPRDTWKTTHGKGKGKGKETCPILYDRKKIPIVQAPVMERVLVHQAQPLDDSSMWDMYYCSVCKNTYNPYDPSTYANNWVQLEPPCNGWSCYACVVSGKKYDPNAPDWCFGNGRTRRRIA
jgi:hypothetical protein